MLLEDPPVVAEINGSFYVLQRRERLIPYKNITLTVGGAPRNFTIMAKKIELKAYRLEGECFKPVWNCTVLKFENGSIISNCPKNWPSSIKTEMPGVQTTFTYSNYNPKKFRSVLFNSKPLVYYTEPIKTKLGSGIPPLLFYQGKAVKLDMELREIPTCKESNKYWVFVVIGIALFTIIGIKKLAKS